VSRSNQRVYKIKDKCPRPAPVITADGAELTSTAADTYEWFYNNEPIPNSNAATFTAFASGFYTVQTTYGNGCTGTSEPYLYLTTGVADAEEAQVLMMPVPANGSVDLVRGAQQGAWTVELRDLSGRLLGTHAWTGDRTTIDLNALPEATYVVRAVDANGDQVMRRLLPVIR
jgi:hypothetical protein